MIVRLLHDAVSAVHAAPSAGATPRCAEALRERGGLAPPLIPPLLSPHAEADVGMCTKADELQKYLVSAKGFAYGVEGKDAKMKPGVIGTAAGDEARFCVDASRLALSQPFVVIIGHLISYEHMGQVSVQCEGECGCEEGPIDAHVEGGKFSVFKARTLNLRKVKPAAPAAGARPDCGCIVKLTILEKTGSGERKFKVLSLMTAARGATCGTATRRASTTGRRRRGRGRDVRVTKLRYGRRASSGRARARRARAAAPRRRRATTATRRSRVQVEAELVLVATHAVAHQRQRQR